MSRIVAESSRINDVYLENVAALEKELGDAELAIDKRMHDLRENDFEP